MRVRWLRKALRSLDDEATERILQSVAMLEHQPGIGRPGRVPGTRELVVSKTRYVVPYRVRGEVVEILRVFHTSRRPPRQEPR